MGQFRVTPQRRPDPAPLDDERQPEPLGSGPEAQAASSGGGG
jgi:hypothetical protein